MLGKGRSVGGEHMQEHKSSALAVLFRRLQMRDSLSEEEESALTAAAGELRTHPAGSSIRQEGEEPTTSALLVNGFATRFNMTDDGGRQTTAIHLPGDFVDLETFPLAALDHSIDALSDCTVLHFPHEKLLDITQKLPHLTRLLWMLTLLDAAIVRRWLVSKGRTSAESHMAHLICELYLRMESVGLASAHKMDLPMTQEQLSDVLGLSPVHVNRTLRRLRDLGLVTWAGGLVEILEWQQLAEVGQFDQNFLYQARFPARASTSRP